MGIDLFISTLSVPDAVEPDFGAARRALAAMSDDALAHAATELISWLAETDLTDEEATSVAAVRMKLAEVIDAVEQVVTVGSREVSEIRVPGRRIYVTGGLSHGELPNALMAVFDDFIGTGLASEAGFEELDSEDPRPGVPAMTPDLQLRLVKALAAAKTELATFVLSRVLITETDVRSEIGVLADRLAGQFTAVEQSAAVRWWATIGEPRSPLLSIAQWLSECLVDYARYSGRLHDGD